MKLLPPFGKNYSCHAQGYDLGLILGHLQGLIDAEAENMKVFNKTKKATRLKLVEEALQNLEDAYNMGNEK